MNAPIYIRPVDLKEALQDLAEGGQDARILAGGTDLIIAMRKGLIHPEMLVDVTRIDELRGIRMSDDFIHIGALTTHGQLRNSQELAQWAPMLVDACRDIGSVQIRNLATLGGNLGNASPAGDTIPVLYVLKAEVHLISLSGERWIPIEAFFTGPGKSVCRRDEIIAEVRFPFYNGQWKGFFLKIGQRRALRVAKVSAAGWLHLEKGTVVDCCLAVGAVAPTVIRLNNAENKLKGASLTMDRIQMAALDAGSDCSPIDDIRSTIEFRRAMTRVLVRRGLETILNEVKNG
jgi:CO/xanthine dehydrogenase FAD-binding subunit